MTSLHISSEHSEAEQNIISTLVTAGSCDVNVRNKLGRTALHLAAKLGNIHNLKVLIDSGCDRSVKDKLGFTAVGLAFKFNQKGSADILLHYKPRRSRSSSKDSLLDENRNEPALECKGAEKEEETVRKDCVCATSSRVRDVKHVHSFKQSKKNQIQFQEHWNKVLLKLKNRDVKEGEQLSWKINHLLGTMVTRKRDKLDGLTSYNSWKTLHVFERKLWNTIPSCVSFSHYPFLVYSVASFDARTRKRCSLALIREDLFGRNADRRNLETGLLAKLLTDLKGTLLCSRNPRASFCIERRNLPAGLTSFDLEETRPEGVPVFDNFEHFAQTLKELCKCKSEKISSRKCADSEAKSAGGIHTKSNKILIVGDSDRQERQLRKIMSEFGVDEVQDFLSCLSQAINTRNLQPPFVEDFVVFFLENSKIFTYCLNSKYSLFRTILDKYLSTSSPWIADKIASLFLQVCVALSCEKRLLLRCAGDIMQKGLSHEHCNASSLGNCILVRMGLLKGEFDVNIVSNLEGPLLALEHIFGEDYFPRNLASTFASFLSKSSPKLFGLEELRLRVLVSAVTREVLPTSVQEGERETGRSFKRICDLAALEQDKELLSKCMDSLFFRTFVELKCRAWPVGESLLTYLGLLKNEYSIEIVRNLKCALKLLFPVVKQSYFPQELKEMFLVFLKKPNPSLNSSSWVVDEIVNILVNKQGDW